MGCDKLKIEMEAGQIDVDGSFAITSYASVASRSPPTQEEQFDGPKFYPNIPSSTKMNKINSTNQELQEKDTPPSVSRCYVFKSRLQEYCQKAGLTTPVYDTIKEGPSHEPFFKSTVTVNNVRYDSLPHFFNRKAAEQSAAEVALIELAKFNDMDSGITQPVHETGLCKNLLQEYAQKMNYAIPLYDCRKEEKEGRMPMYSCVVEIGGIKYIGASASTKKEAEIKAARTALLAIQTAVPISEEDHTNHSYTVIPQKKKISDLAVTTQTTKPPLKPKKGQGRFKKQQRKRRQPANREGTAHLEVNIDAASSEQPNMVGEGGMEVHAVETIESQGKTNGDSIIFNNSQSKEPSIHGDSGKFGLNPCTASGVCVAVADNPSSEPDAAAGSNVNMVGEGMHAVETIDSQSNTNGGSIMYKECQREEM